MNSDDMIQLDRTMSKNLRIIYSHPMDKKTHQNYKTDKWMVSKILFIIYNIRMFDVIIDKIQFNYDNYSSNSVFIAMSDCFEFIWEQLIRCISKINDYFTDYYDKDEVFNIFFHKYYVRFVERFNNY
jgi:hypothetical protein